MVVTITHNSSPRGSGVLFWTPQIPTLACAHTPKDTCINTQLKRKKNKALRGDRQEHDVVIGTGFAEKWHNEGACPVPFHLLLYWTSTMLILDSQSLNL